MNLKLDLDYKKWLPVLRKIQPFVFGAALVAVFGYTALAVKAALNIQPDVATVVAADPAAKISFDKNTIEALKKLNVVQGTVPAVDLGKDDPFK